MTPDGADGIRFSVGEFTTPGLSFAEDLEVYRKAGADGIGIDAGLKLRNFSDDLARFHDSGLAATFCFPETNTVFPGKLPRGPEDPADRVESMCVGVRALAAFEPQCVVCGPGPLSGRDPAEAWTVIVEGLRRAARAAAGEGLPLAVEPLHPTLEAEWSALTSLGQALRLIDDIGEQNVGIMFDVWHLWDSPRVRELLAANADRVIAVQVDDWRDPTRSWCDRVLPGDGIADVRGLLRLLRIGGYRGWLELEIFSDDGLFEQAFPDSLWAQDPVQLIRRGREKTMAAWADSERDPAADAMGDPIGER
jgi:sugar phosphate isomerase/epimerase